MDVAVVVGVIAIIVVAGVIVGLHGAICVAAFDFESV